MLSAESEDQTSEQSLWEDACMKKMISMTLTPALLLNLAACGTSSATEENTIPEESETADTIVSPAP